MLLCPLYLTLYLSGSTSAAWSLLTPPEKLLLLLSFKPRSVYISNSSKACKCQSVTTWSKPAFTRSHILLTVEQLNRSGKQSKLSLVVFIWSKTVRVPLFHYWTVWSLSCYISFHLTFHMHALNVTFREVKVILVDKLFKAKWKINHDIFFSYITLGLCSNLALIGAKNLQVVLLLFF